MKKIIFILLCSWFTICAAGAQCAAKNEAIQAGELLTYDLKFNWKFIWKDAGVARMDMQGLIRVSLVSALIWWLPQMVWSISFSRCVIR